MEDNRNDQERYLDEGLNVIKAKKCHLGIAIENNNLRQALKESSIMLNELKTSKLYPKNYYSLFSMVMDELHYLCQFFREEVRRGRLISHLYNAVQQAHHIIPRLYLMITAGRVYIETSDTPTINILFEILNAIKGVQNPTRGLFLRYYLLKMMKDKLPDNSTDIENTLKFIFQNLDDMNRLWIRLSSGSSGNSKLISDNERNELKVLVGENIVRISDLETIDVNIFQNMILPRIIAIILDSKDGLSQQYLMECVIHVFSENFIITTLRTILNVFTKLSQSVDVKGLFISILDKISKYLSNDINNKEGEINLKVQLEEIFEDLKSSVTNIVSESLKTSSDELKILELLAAFMKFTLKCCPEEKKIKTVNDIIYLVMLVLKECSSNRIGRESIKQLQFLLKYPLEHNISIFKISQFSEVMAFLDFTNRTSMALNILENLQNISLSENKNLDDEEINTVDKVQFVLGYIKSLTDSNLDSNFDKSSFSNYQLSVSKLVFLVKNKNPQKYLEMLELVQNTFTLSGDSRISYYIPTLVQVYLNFVEHIYFSVIKQSSEENLKNPSKFDLSSLDKLLAKKMCMDVLLKTLKIYESYLVPVKYGLIFRTYMDFLRVINYCKELDTSNITSDIVNKLLEILESTKDSDKKLELLINFINNLSVISCIDQKEYKNLCTKFTSIANSFVKRSDQANSMIAISNLYNHFSYPKELDECKECLESALEYSDYAMSTNPKSCLFLYITLVNKYLYFLEKDFKVIVCKKVSRFLDKINNCIKSIKAESSNIDLKDIDLFFNSTIESILLRKERKKGTFYDEIEINFKS